VTHKNYSISLLLAGDFTKGWQEYEWRWQSGELTPRNYQQTVWDGQPLQGKTLLVYWEQGFGDTLQFVRYLPFINKNGGKIILECQEPLFRLLENYSNIDQLIKSGEHIPDFDLHIPLMSLPRVMGTNSLSQIPAQTPYLFVPTDGIEKIPLPAGNRETQLKVGLVWGVNHAHPKSHKRSCPLEYLLPLTQIPVIQFYSLQVGPQVADLTNLADKIAHPIIDLSDLIRDFADTAILIEQLDFVITVDTAVAHLAGALGKPVWLILPFVPDWRWLLQEEIAVWYPTMRLFRQTEAGNWRSAVNQLIQVLLSIINQQPKIQPQTNQYFNKALEKQNAGEFLTAVNFYQRAIAYQPSYASAYSNLGNAFMGLQQSTVAIAHFQKAIKLKPDLIQAYINLGAAYQADKDYERAITTYQQAIELNPGFAITYNNLACLHLICNNIQAAKSYSEQAIALYPSLPDPYTNLGSVLLELGEVEAA
ncbi:MAG: tetratricopeptide repeat protein, partial [Microcoleaceae cyanobacterium]